MFDFLRGWFFIRFGATFSFFETAPIGYTSFDTARGRPLLPDEEGGSSHEGIPPGRDIEAELARIPPLRLRAETQPRLPLLNW